MGGIVINIESWTDGILTNYSDCVGHGIHRYPDDQPPELGFSIYDYKTEINLSDSSDVQYQKVKDVISNHFKSRPID